MNDSLKAALLSGLAFPGLGQIYLKCYKRAALIIAAAISGLAMIIWNAIKLGVALMEKVSSDGGPINMETVSDAASQAAVSLLMINIGLLLVIVSWIAGTIDAYVAGKRTERN